MSESEPAGVTAAARSTLIVVCLVSAVMALNASSLNVALPTLSREFEASSTEGSWLLLSYLVANTACLLLFGRLSDVWGQRGLYLGGLVIFSVTSLLAGFAPNVEVLIGLRVVSAIGGAVLIGNGATLIHQAFPRDSLGGAMGLYAASFPTANLIGPTLGGLIVDHVGWQWVFWLNVPVCLVALAAGHLLLPRPVVDKRAVGLDLPGNLVIMIGVVMLTIGITSLTDLGWRHPLVIGGIVGSFLLVPVLLLVERRAAAPVVDVVVIRRVGRLFLAGFFTGAGRFPLIVLASLYFQSVVGVAPGTAGMMLLPMPVGMILASLTLGRLSRRWTAHQIMSGGSVVGTCGVALVALAIHLEQTWLVMATLAIVGLATGLFIGTNATVLLERAPEEALGVVNATRLMLQNTGNVLSLAIALTLLTALLPSGLGQAVLAANVPDDSVAAVTSAFTLVCLFLLTLGAVGAWYSFPRRSAREQASSPGGRVVRRGGLRDAGAGDEEAEGRGEDVHHDAVDRGRDGDGRVVEDAQGDREGHGGVVDPDLHRGRDRLRLAESEDPSPEVAQEEARAAEQRHDHAHLLEVAGDVVPLAEDRTDRDHDQHDDREDPDRLVRPGGERLGPAPHEHPDADRNEHDRDDLDDLAELQAQRVAGVEVDDRGVGDQRDGDRREHRVHRSQGDVERDVAAEEVAEEVGGGPARRGGQQHDPDGDQRIHVRDQDQPEGDQWQHQDLEGERHDDGSRGAYDPAEVFRGQAQAQPEHDDGQRDGEADREQGRVVHLCSSSMRGRR
jgi:MFS family permease